MKTLLALALLLSSSSAFAMVPAQIAQTMSDVSVLEALKDQHLRNIEAAPAARCMGCFGLRIIAENREGELSVYEAHGMDFAGRFRVSISKME
ncbi:MAG: hypothetical protein EOP11_22900 [Proteobacteria bacterium]|nr:MAG: hypothetical protein EOP11_22900 [Pseudomonadota bacterium]